MQRSALLLVRHLGVAFARIWTLNESSGMLELQASAGMYTHLDGPHSRVEVGHLKIGWIARECRPHLTNNIANDPHIGDQDWAQAEGLIAFAGFPLLVEDRCVGVMAMFARRPFTEGVLADLAPFADGIAQCVERKRAETALRLSEARKSAIMETSLDSIVTCDGSGSILEFNPAAERTFGFRRADVVGQDMSELIVPPHLRDRHRSGMAHYLATGEGPILNQRIEMTALRRDGTEFPIELSITRITGEGPPLFTAYIRDITDRRMAENALEKQSEWLRVTLSSIGDAVVTTDALGRVTFMNGVAETLTGWPTADAAGRNLPEVFRIVNELTRLPVDDPALRALREGAVVGLANHTILIARDGSRAHRRQRRADARRDRESHRGGAGVSGHHRASSGGGRTEGRGPAEGRLSGNARPRAPQPAGPPAERAPGHAPGERRRRRRRPGPRHDGPTARAHGAAGR